MIENLEVMGGASNPFTQLVWPLKDDDPDIAYSIVPYEKVSDCSHTIISALSSCMSASLFYIGFQYIEFPGNYCGYRSFCSLC